MRNKLRDKPIKNIWNALFRFCYYYGDYSPALFYTL